MFTGIRFPQIAAFQHAHQLKQLHFLQLAHSLQKPIQSELRAFARAIWFAERGPMIFLDWRYRLRKEIHPDKAIWWIEADIPPFDRYRCAAYRVELDQTAAGENRLSFQTGSQRYEINLNDISTIHAAFIKASFDPALVISRRMGTAFD